MTQERLDAIRKYTEKLDAIAKGYRRLAMACERMEATEALLSLTETAGKMSCDSLSVLATTLELLYEAGERSNPVEGETPWYMTDSEVAQCAYALADAMMREREKAGGT